MDKNVYSQELFWVEDELENLYGWEQMDDYLIDFTIKAVRNKKEYDEESDTAWNIIKDLADNPQYRKVVLELIKKYATDGFLEDYKDYLIDENYHYLDDRLNNEWKFY